MTGEGQPADSAARPGHLPWGVLGVPSSAAAHWPGIEQAPAVLREAGLVPALSAGRFPVQDFGDLPVTRWAAHREAGRPNNAEAVAEVLDAARARLADILRQGARPVVLGGECTLALALVAACADLGRDVGVVYIDGGQDLALPADHPEEPILDSMGVAHLLDLPGTDDVIAGVGPHRPLLQDADVVFFGYSDEEEDRHGQVGSVRIPASAVSADSGAAAQRALAVLGNEEIIVHLDVDVLDFLEVPAADIAGYGRGPALAELTQALRVLVHDPRCAGLLLVEYNPDHDPGRRAAAQLVTMLRAVFA
ncbi:Arginase [Arthrobacter saudimassiliensis]|uniref:Arginase n=1 Tax=Arthrobacter saudimassiliensis TaxID=1461584 RepID=A0A078MNE0_9MICC|nr:Arginase [Arthrobacter saudimassiliensis]